MGITVRLVAVGKFVSVYVPAATLPSESVVQALDSIVNQDTCAAQVNRRGIRLCHTVPSKTSSTRCVGGSPQLAWPHGNICIVALFAELFHSRGEKFSGS